MRVGLRHHPEVLRRTQQQRVVGAGVEFDLDLSDRMFQLITGGAMHLRDRADAQGVLSANAFARGDHFTAVEQRAQIAADLPHARVRFQRDDFCIKGVDLATLRFETHGADDVGPLHQPRCVGNCQTAEAGHARRAVDQAQTVLGTKLHRLQAFCGQRLLRRHNLPAIADVADAQQGDTDVRHVRQVAHRTLRRHLRGDAAIEQRQQAFDHTAMNAGFAVAVVVDCRADDRPSLFVAKHRTDAAGMAEQGVARELAELFTFERDVGQSAQTGVDAIGPLAAFDDALNDGLRVVDTRPGALRQLQLRAAPSHGDHVLPMQAVAGDDDFFSLGHLKPQP